MSEMQAWRAAAWAMLSGIIGALLGQNCRRMMQPVQAVLRTGAAADVLAARFGTRGMLATDLFHATAYC